MVQVYRGNRFDDQSMAVNQDSLLGSFESEIFFRYSSDIIL